MRMVSVSYPQTRFRVVSMISYLNVVVVHCIHFSISPFDSVLLGRLFHKCRAFRDSMLIIIISNDILLIKSINLGFAELKGKPLNTSFLLAPFWLKANIRNVMIYSLKLYT
jgi:hypothetical protein